MKSGLFQKIAFLSIPFAIISAFSSSLPFAQTFNYQYNSPYYLQSEQYKNNGTPTPANNSEHPNKNEFAPTSNYSQSYEAREQPSQSPPPQALSLSASNQSLGKKMAEIPEITPNAEIDASDLRDPLLLIRGMNDDSANVLRPGTTIDGIRFYTSDENNSFIESEYRRSNFKINDVFGRVVAYDKGQRCLTCHGGIEEISDSHKFSCTRCHSGNGRAFSKKSAHKNMVSNPSDLAHAPKYCGKCHADHINNVSKSSMATAKGQINLTRYNWGIQKLEIPALSLIPDTEKGELIFPPETYNDDQAELVDDYLQKKCLRCHLQSPSPHRPGEYRATGCSSCHMIYSNDGMTMTRDRAIQSSQKNRLKKQKKIFNKKVAANSFKNPRGYPILHKFSVAIPSSQCETCHHDSGPGAEYEGLFKKPARQKPHSNVIDKNKPLLYGAEHKFLIQDIHREKGMHCIDCHESEELKNPNSTFPDLNQSSKTKCEDCHGSHENGPGEFLLVKSSRKAKQITKKISLNPNLKGKIKFGDLILRDSEERLRPHIKKFNGKWVLISKVTGKKHVVPILKDKKKPTGHSLKQHMDGIECSACHARWTYTEWGSHVILDKRLNLKSWKDWSFSDPNLQQTLFDKEKSLEESPYFNQDFNWLTAEESANDIFGQWQPGTWIELLSKASWDKMILGKNSKGKYSIFKPRKQYFFTEISADGELIKSSTIPSLPDGKLGLLLTPYTPHTIRKISRTCKDCHSNPENLGLGDPKLKVIPDAPSFYQELSDEASLPGEFQLWQTIDSNGSALQSVWPPDARFLNSKELFSIQEKTDRYRANQYLALRERGFPKLLNRNSFPFDIKHKANEDLYGSPFDSGDSLFEVTLPEKTVAPSYLNNSISLEGSTLKKEVTPVLPETNLIIEPFSPSEDTSEMVTPNLTIPSNEWQSPRENLTGFSQQ